MEIYYLEKKNDQDKKDYLSNYCIMRYKQSIYFEMASIMELSYWTFMPIDCTTIKMKKIQLSSQLLMERKF
jgi:hypothetical protein